MNQGEPGGFDGQGRQRRRSGYAVNFDTLGDAYEKDRRLYEIVDGAEAVWEVSSQRGIGPGK